MFGPFLCSVGNYKFATFSAFYAQESAKGVLLRIFSFTLNARRKMTPYLDISEVYLLSFFTHLRTANSYIHYVLLSRDNLIPAKAFGLCAPNISNTLNARRSDSKSP